MGAHTDLGNIGAIFSESGKILFSWYFHSVFTVEGGRECAESIAMMIYYCQGTGCSLRSQYSLQESIFKIFFATSPTWRVLYCSTVYFTIVILCHTLQFAQGNAQFYSAGNRGEVLVFKMLS